MSRVALLSADEGIERRLARTLGKAAFDDLVATYDLGTWEPSAAAAALADRHTDVVVIGPGQSLDEALTLAETIEREHPEITTVLVADPTPEVWERALQAGVRHVVPVDSSPAQLARVVRRGLDVAELRRSNIVIDLRDQLPGGALDDAGKGRIITVLSPKGGAGKTTVATNLAVGLAALHPYEVALVDLDLQFGDVATALHLEPTSSLADLVDPDAAALKALLVAHREGVFALCAPEDPAVGEQIEPDIVSRALRALAADLPYVVVDTGAGLDAVALSAIDASSDLVFVGAMDVPSIRSLRKLLDALDRLDMTEAARHVVLNRADSRVGMNADDVADALGLPISVSVPSSRAIPLSINHGVPVLLSDPKSPVSRNLQELVRVFSGTPAPRSQSIFRFRRSAR